VRHAVCEAHGELLHEAEANLEQAGAALDTAKDSGGVSSGPAVESASGEHDHEHCGFASEGRVRTLVERALIEVTLDRDAGSGVSEAAALPAAGEQLYRFAPKTSPPA
jgi:hypothetical protein